MNRSFLYTGRGTFTMINHNDNKELILAQERKFAAQLGRSVFSKPQLHTWMILIPFLFVFFIQDLMKYKKGRRAFSDNYLLSHEKALNEAEDALVQGRKPDAEAIARQADLKGKARERYAEFLTVLVEHYTCLLQAKGDSYESLVRSAYGNSRTNFLLFTNLLNQAEKKLNQALTPQLSKDQDGVASTIQKMERGLNQLRRSEAEQIFMAV
jgi:hypothetical protein